MSRPICAWASISEKGTTNGKKGDQTGREVKIGLLYDFGQTYVLRCKNVVMRKRIRQAAMRIAKNNHIGYGQIDRTSSFAQFEKIKWKIAKIPQIKTNCNIDCSELALSAINFAYNKRLIAPGNNSSLLPKACVNSKKFQNLAYRKGMKLKKGDIIGKAGHVIVCCEDGIAI